MFVPVPKTRCLVGRQGIVKRLQLRGVEFHMHRPKIFFQIFATLGPRYSNDVVALVQDPGEGDLGGGDTFVLRHTTEELGRFEVGLKVPRLQARIGVRR